MAQTFTILGPPIGEGRPRAVRMGGFVRVHAAPKSAEWRALAAQQMAAERVGECIVEPVRVTMVAIMPRPASIPKKAGAARLWRATKPDIDNIAKAVFDALVTAGVLKDDCQVVSCDLQKPTAAVGETARVVVSVETMAART